MGHPGQLRDRDERRLRREQLASMTMAFLIGGIEAQAPLDCVGGLFQVAEPAGGEAYRSQTVGSFGRDRASKARRSLRHRASHLRALVFRHAWRSTVAGIQATRH
jgi:hypothetical protein